MKLFMAYIQSELGPIRISGTEEGISEVHFMDESIKTYKKPPECLKDCVKQLEEYFQGKRTTFSLKLLLEGTSFQKKVWKQLSKIPFGSTASYRDIARAIGKREAVRAVGGANGKNRIAIIIPCHRIIGSSGALVGYGGGLWRKGWLLSHEKRFLKKKRAD